MKYIESNIGHIKPEVIIKYLNNIHWVQDGVFKAGKLIQYVSPNEDDSVIVLADNNFSDYLSSTYNVLQTIAKYQSIPLESIIYKLTSIPSDTLKWRVNNAFTANGIIQIDKASEIIDNITNILATSIKDTIAPQRFHKKVKTKDVSDELSKYALGQTQIGSYIFNVLCPLGDQQLEIFTDPLSRRVNEKLMIDLSTIQDDVLNHNINKLDEVVDKGDISVNFLEAIIETYETTNDSDLEISIDWNIDFPNLAKDNIPTSINLKPNIIEPIGQIIEKYRPHQEDKRDIIFGKISSIKGSTDPQSNEPIVINVTTIIENDKKANIEVVLEPQYRTKVANAFDDGATVKMDGTLNLTPRKKVMKNPSFEVMN